MAGSIFALKASSVLLGQVGSGSVSGSVGGGGGGGGGSSFFSGGGGPGGGSFGIGLPSPVPTVGAGLESDLDPQPLVLNTIAINNVSMILRNSFPQTIVCLANTTTKSVRVYI